MLRVVAPLLHTFPEDAEDVKVTEPPGQKVVGPPAMIVGCKFCVTVTAAVALVAEVQPLLLNVFTV